MPTPAATVEEFKARFTRDFVYADEQQDDPSKVLNVDIQNALNDGSLVFNECLWIDALEKTTAFLFLSAHLLVLNIQAAGGLTAGSGKGIRSSGGGTVQTKSVGSVSVAFALPDGIIGDPILSQFMRTDYGQKYLQFLTPRLVGHVRVAPGWNDTEAPSGLI